MIRNILFDFDGTLADTAPGILATEVATFTKMGLPVPSEEAMRSGIGLPLGESLRKAGNLPDELIDEAVTTYRALFPIYEVGNVSVFPGVQQTLDELQARGIRMAIATSRGSNSLGVFLERFDMAKFFEDKVTATDKLPAKPAPDIVLTLLARMGISKEETLVVGDTTFDIGMGASAGCRTCAVTWGNHSAEMLQTASPTYMIDEISKILDLVSE